MSHIAYVKVHFQVTNECKIEIQLIKTMFIIFRYNSLDCIAAKRNWDPFWIVDGVLGR